MFPYPVETLVAALALIGYSDAHFGTTVSQDAKGPWGAGGREGGRDGGGHGGLSRGGDCADSRSP